MCVCVRKREREREREREGGGGGGGAGRGRFAWRKYEMSKREVANKLSKEKMRMNWERHFYLM